LPQDKDTQQLFRTANVAQNAGLTNEAFSNLPSHALKKSALIKYNNKDL